MFIIIPTALLTVSPSRHSTDRLLTKHRLETYLNIIVGLKIERNRLCVKRVTFMPEGDFTVIKDILSEWQTMSGCSLCFLDVILCPGHVPSSLNILSYLFKDLRLFDSSALALTCGVQ